MMRKAFFINGGVGRVLCAIPALEWYKSNVDPDVVIVAEAWVEIFLASALLRDNVYPVNHKDLFTEKLIDKEIISPEPYRLNSYFTQKCNLIQAFDILINNLDEIPETKEFNLDINKVDQAFGYNCVNQVKQQMGKDKAIVFQPFGSGANIDGSFIIDSSGRSFEVRDVFSVVEQLSAEYAIILMSTIEIPTDKPMGAAIPKANLLQWMGIINACDGFVGCDSVGQHYAHALGKPATVVIGSTFPENISYPGNNKFTIIDNGIGKRNYAPFRISHDHVIERNNENLMIMETKTVEKVIQSVKKQLK
jgi:hypothetical protein